MATLKVPVGPDDHIQGNPKAPITLVEYGDYECPACGLAYPIVKAVQKHFGRDLRFVFRNSPLAQMHPNAESAAETAEWAASHRRFWEMHDALYENQTMLGLPLYLSLANALQLPEEELSVAEIAARGFPRDTVLRVQRLLYSAEYKRRQAPPGVKITSRNFGRDRRYPLTNAFRET